MNRQLARAIVLIFCLLASAAHASLLWPVRLPADKDLYAVVVEVGSERGGQKAIPPLARVCRVALERGEDGDVVAGALETLHVFDDQRVDKVMEATDANGTNWVILYGQFADDAIPERSVRVLCSARPAQVKGVKVSPKHHITRLILKGDSIYMGAYKCDHGETVGSLRLLNLATLAQSEGELQDWQGVMGGETVEANGEGGLTILRKGLDGITLHCCPPADLRGDDNRLKIRHNGPKYLVLSTGFVSEAQEKFRLLCLNKTKGAWTEHIVKGDRTETQVLGDLLACRIAWDYPEARRFGLAYTGEWTIINLKTQKEETLMLNRAGRPLLATETFVVAASRDSLLYLPIRENGLICVSWMTRLLTDADVPNIQALFFGPRLPEGTNGVEAE